MKLKKFYCEKLNKNISLTGLSGLPIPCAAAEPITQRIANTTNNHTLFFIALLLYKQIKNELIIP